MELLPVVPDVPPVPPEPDVPPVPAEPVVPVAVFVCEDVVLLVVEVPPLGGLLMTVVLLEGGVVVG